MKFMLEFSNLLTIILRLKELVEDSNHSRAIDKEVISNYLANGSLLNSSRIMVIDMYHLSVSLIVERKIKLRHESTLL